MLILANTVLMMLERHPMPAYEAEIIELGNLAFFAAYSFEMLLKLVALSERLVADGAFARQARRKYV